MTTTVTIKVANPNHKRVRLRIVTPESTVPGVPLTEGHVWREEILEHGHEETLYVHQGARIVLDECD